MTDLKTKILKKVEEGKVAMIPRWKFVLYSALGIFGFIFAFLALIFVVSLVLFVLSRYGFMYMPLFGFMATLHALKAIPLTLAFVTAILAILVELLARNYAFSFKTPVLTTLGAMLFLALVVAYLLSETTFHDQVRDYLRRNRIDMMSKMYDRPMPPMQHDGYDVLRGEVEEVATSSFIIKLFDGDVVTVVSTTTIPEFIKEDTDVTVLGNFSGSHFELSQILPSPRPPFGGRHHLSPYQGDGKRIPPMHPRGASTTMFVK